MKLKSIKKQTISLILIIVFIIPITISVLGTEVFAATAVLPSGSTSDDLQAAINSATSGDIIIISSNMQYTTTTPTVTIPAGKTITLQSTEGNNWTLSQPAATESVYVLGNLILQNITIDGRNTGGYISVVGSDSSLTMNSGSVVQNASLAGGVSVSQGTLNINNGAIIRNCRADEGGAGLYIHYATLNMNGGTITNNESILGAGIYAFYSTININNATISNNTVTQTYGGGIYGEYSNITIENSDISGNTANSTGGGICILGGEAAIKNSSIKDNKTIVYHGGGICFTECSFNIEECEITENTGNEYGGGIHLANSEGVISKSNITKNKAVIGGGGGISLDLYSEAEIAESIIADNRAPNGGGIYTSDTKYSDLFIDKNTSFSGNKASAAYIPPENAIELYPNIRFASTSIGDHPLNNYDINYIGEPFIFNIIYTANGGYGLHIGSNINPGDSDIVLLLAETEINRDGYSFIGWNTAPDGSEINYQPGDSIILDDNVILYAQWSENNKNSWLFLIIFLFIILTIIISFLYTLIKCSCYKKCKKSN